MDREIGERWATALESGRFKQGNGLLKYEGTDGAIMWCCLGVLCELHRQEFGGKWESDDCDNRYTYVDRAVSMLPPEVSEWAGVSSGDEERYIGYNDGYIEDAQYGVVTLSFPEIAQKIREDIDDEALIERLREEADKEYGGD